MIFSSLAFIFRFLPIFLIIYYLVPMKYRNLLLFICSAIFYSFGDLKGLILLFLSTLVNFLSAVKMEEAKDLHRKKVWFYTALCYDLGMLIFYKYSGFMIQNINVIQSGIFHAKQMEPLTTALPLGISFYTFQVISYIIDVYRGEVQAEKLLINMGVYVCMFPKLISGPIVRYSEMRDQIRHRNISLEGLESGLKLFTIGLGFKVLIADRVAFLWNDIQTIGFVSISTPLAWLGVLGYTLQLYFDFYGYSLMAIGLGEMLGFKLPDNFNHPYISKSVSEFWRRWHITLGTWFKDYVYIPLGGNRRGIKRLALNLFVVWLLTGIWHGAGFNYILWGIVLFLLIFIEKIFLKRWLDKSNILSRVYLWTVVPLSWMLFAINKLSDVRIYYGRLFSLIPGVCVNSSDFVKYIERYWWIFLIGIFFCLPVAGNWYSKNKKNLVLTVFLFFVFWFSVYFIANGSNNPFMYFKF